MSRRPILLLVNPVAGGKPGSGPGLDDDPARLEPAALEDALLQRGLEVRRHELTADDDAPDGHSPARRYRVVCPREASLDRGNPPTLLRDLHETAEGKNLLQGSARHGSVVT